MWAINGGDLPATQLTLSCVPSLVRGGPCFLSTRSRLKQRILELKECFFSSKTPNGRLLVWEAEVCRKVPSTVRAFTEKRCGNYTCKALQETERDSYNTYKKITCVVVCLQETIRGAFVLGWFFWLWSVKLWGRNEKVGRREKKSAGQGGSGI